MVAGPIPAVRSRVTRIRGEVMNLSNGQKGEMDQGRSRCLPINVAHVEYLAEIAGDTVVVAMPFNSNWDPAKV